MSKNKISTDGGQNMGQTLFGALDGLSLPAGKPVAAAVPKAEEKPSKNRGRVEVLRMTAGRGGKTVTVARAFVGIGLPEKEQLAKKMQKACGSGGTVKDGQIEIQGDQRDTVMRVLTEAGFRPVLAGG